MKKIIIFVFFISIGFVFAQGGPISSCGWSYGYNHVNLNGRIFTGASVDASYCEQKGRVYLSGIKETIELWLYNTYVYHNGNDKELLNKYIPAWIEQVLDQTIDFDRASTITYDNRIPDSIKALMKQRDCDMTVINYHNAGVVIISLNKASKRYTTYIYPFPTCYIGFSQFLGDPNDKCCQLQNSDSIFEDIINKPGTISSTIMKQNTDKIKEYVNVIEKASNGNLNQLSKFTWCSEDLVYLLLITYIRYNETGDDKYQIVRMYIATMFFDERNFVNDNELSAAIDYEEKTILISQEADTYTPDSPYLDPERYDLIREDIQQKYIDRKQKYGF